MINRRPILASMHIHREYDERASAARTREGTDYASSGIHCAARNISPSRVHLRSVDPIDSRAQCVGVHSDSSSRKSVNGEKMTVTTIAVAAAAPRRRTSMADDNRGVCPVVPPPPQSSPPLPPPPSSSSLPSHRRCS